MESISLKSPAKLNLFLEVVNKRPDNFHNIETVFERIDLFDHMLIEKSPGPPSVECDSPDVPIDDSNLCLKAVRLAEQYAGKKLNVKIKLKKNIPAAAGLGGGSSNAAYTLTGINELFDLGLKETDIFKIGEQVGADVCFFLSNSPFAAGRGIGEKIERIETSASFWHVIVVPELKIPTKSVYEALDLSLTAKKRDAKIIQNYITNKDIELLPSALYNRLEDIVLRKFNRVDKLKRVLGKFGLAGTALMSGSGPSVFCIHTDREEAMKVKSEISRIALGSCRVFTAKTLL
jgi:4-diphosphocytidyl-2-C-methyl-D-erythritol kinase